MQRQKRTRYDTALQQKGIHIQDHEFPISLLPALLKMVAHFSTAFCASSQLPASTASLIDGKYASS